MSLRDRCFALLAAAVDYIQQYCFGLQALRQKTKRLEALRIAKHHSLLPLFQTLANGPNMDEDESSAPGYDIKVRIEPVLHDSFHDEHSLNFFARKLRTFWRNRSGDRI